MRNILLALGLGMTSASTFAATVATGSVHFVGNVNSGTCAIEIFDPSTGQVVSRILMGNVNAAQFKQPDDEAANRAFGLRLTPGAGCILIPGASATVTFTGKYGGAGAAGTLYALAPGGSTGLALIIKDDLGTPISPTVPSRSYPLHETQPTDMLFSAAYKATSASVTAGYANTDIGFNVDIP
ncbi:MAG: type 1 fimbrial protein [Candidatus Pseudomonas phytovorans]|uniref:Type 1 fimbrial protein n=1 Tax=Candidatus Pseudomonas phytovorans TaxID=3121377 RepID=A0AAJ5WFZ2_9PSED|nr:fimbrial protein [Pseudomonas sp.]WEK29701.1 MAG: type 1 fimbrial protein [Pseudomonas sp.]